jgi:hypothetical protein
MGELAPLIDGEALAVAHLKADATLDALVGNRVSTELPAGFLAEGRLQVEGEHGLPVDADTSHLQRVRIQVKAFGETKEEAFDVAALAYASLRGAVGSHALAIVTRVTQYIGLRWSPDPETDIPRYLFGLVLYCHAVPE